MNKIMTPEQLDALADNYAKAVIASPVDFDEIDNIGGEMYEALREIAATLRAGRLTDEHIIQLGREQEGLFTDNHECELLALGKAIADAAVLAAMYNRKE